MDKEKVVNILDRTIEYLLYLMIFFIPISKAAIEIIFGLTIAIFFFKQILKPDLAFLKNITYIFLLLFFSFCALSLFNSGAYLGKGLKALFGKWFEYIFIFILVANTFNRPKRLGKVMHIFIASAALIGIDAIFQRVAGFDFLRGKPLIEGVITASFQNQNALAAFLIPALLVALTFLFTMAKKKNHRLAMAILITVLGACLIFTGSRGAWLGFIFGLILMGFLMSKLRIFIPILCIFITLLLFLPASRVRVISLFKAGGTSQRLTLAKSALDMVRDNPLLGKGLGTFMDYFRQYAYIPDVVYYAHNSYLQMAAEAGVFTLLWFLLFCASILAKAVTSFIHTRNGILLGLICGVCGFMIHAFFDNHLYSLQLAALFWFLLGLTYAAASLETGKGQSPKNIRDSPLSLN